MIIYNTIIYYLKLKIIINMWLMYSYEQVNKRFISLVVYSNFKGNLHHLHGSLQLAKWNNR